MEFDHIRGRSNNSIENCQALYPTHHRLKTKHDAVKIRIAKSIQNKKRRTSPESKHEKLFKITASDYPAPFLNIHK